MDLLGKQPELVLDDESWRIYSRQSASAPQFIGSDATVINSTMTAGCEIYGKVENSVLGQNVKVEAGATVKDSVIMDNVVIRAGAQVHYSIIDSGVTVGCGAKVGVGGSPDSIAVIGADVSLPDGNTVEAGSMISEI